MSSAALPLHAAAQEDASENQPPIAITEEGEVDTDDTPDGQRRLGTVTTTGSRISGLAEDSAVQAFSIGRDEIEASGALSIIDVLSDLPAAGGGQGTFSTSTSGALSGDTPPGAASVSLRGLGASSTLTLINGRRASITSFAQGQENFIDVNAIPLAAIERVDILPNGASAIYGADAVAGVVNYILRDDYNGFEVSSSYGNSTADTDEGRFNLNAIYGRSNERHSLVLIGDYYKRNAFFDRDRDITADSIRPSQQGFYPSYNDLFLMFFDQTEEPGDGGCAADDFGVGNLGEFCEVNTNAFTATDDAFESASFMGSYKLKLSDKATWFNEMIFSTTESEGTSSPANFSRAPVDPENPFWPQALIDDIVDEANFDNPGTIYEDFYGFPIYAWGKFLDPRAVEVESETLRLVSGLQYDFDNSWEMEAALVYGQNESTQRGLTGLNRSGAFYDLLLGNLCTDGSRVARWDVDAERPDASFNGDTCEDLGRTTLWYNPFGGQTAQEDGVRELLETRAQRNGEASLFSADVSANGELFNFNGRTIKAAIGAEFRREELSDTPSGDAVATLGNPEPILGFSSTSADAERDQYAIFGELYVPLTDRLDVQLAGRFDDVDGFGSDFNPKVAIRWQPVEPLIFRGAWSTSFRAPSLAQIGAGVRLTSYRVDCEATPGACNGDATASGQALLSEEVGRLDLRAEEAESYNAGVIFEPTNDIRLTLDYYNIRHEDLVGVDEDDFIRRALNGEFSVVDTATDSLSTGTPGLEVTNGFVTDAHFALTNLGYQETSGLDLSYTQYVDVGAGTLSLLADATYLLEFNRKASDDAPVIEEAGEFTYPELLANARVRWSSGKWRTSLGAKYTSSYRDDPTPRILEAVGLSPDAEVDVDEWTVFDFSVSYDYAEHSFIQLSVDNLFDEAPPLALGTSANVDFYNHDSLGRFVTLRINHAF
ncbi:MAG: TonB-dependent receptor [Henriciella sp.]|uniref:TonB-dependent receptor plug domain-containing protein n=1 Tax=Henriciella sp. TaxID=1968823 RepID=UPI003C784E32